MLRSRPGARHIEVLGTCPAGDQLTAERSHEIHAAGRDSRKLGSGQRDPGGRDRLIFSILPGGEGYDAVLDGRDAGVR